MSEKRQRNQQRRQRRKAKSARARPREVSPQEALVQVAILAANSIREVHDGLEAEHWASDFIGGMRRDLAPDEPIDPEFFAALLIALEALGTPDALAVLRALSAIGADGTAAAADRLAATGVPEPPWRDFLGRSRPTAAALLYEPAFDDGVSVIVEFAEPGGGAHALSVFIDHNLDGVVKDVFLADPIATLTIPEGDRVVIRDLDLGEARARIEDAFALLDDMLDPPVNEDVRSLRALLEARLRLLPDGVELPDPFVEVTQDERDQFLSDFLASPEGGRWRGDDQAEYIAQLAIDFGADANHGGPLRWSPVVVEIFMLDWLARTVTEEREFFARVPDVLRDWVAYAGRRRGMAEEPLGEAIAAVDDHREEMLVVVDDPESWGAAKAFVAAAADAGVDLTDREALDRFMERYSDAGA